MERSNFIKLLEEYKEKALRELTKESKVQAALLIQGEFRQAIQELEKVCQTASTGLERVTKEVSNIMEANTFPNQYNRCYFNCPTTKVMDIVVEFLAQKVRDLPIFSQKRHEINIKFDAAIKAAKASRSATKLKELADALGIEAPSIEVTSSVSATVDTEFVKEKIKSVLLLK